MLCVVPNCNKNTGIPFPIGEEGRLLVSKLKLSTDIPSDSIICYGHKQLQDLESSSKGLGITATTTDGHKEPASIIRILQPPKNGYMCRICMSSKNLVKKISDQIDGDVPIMSLIMLTCYPIKLSLNDNLPKEICRGCLNDLRVAHRLRTRCLEAAKKIPMLMESRQAHKRKLSDQHKMHLNVHKRHKFDTVEETIENIKKEIDCPLAVDKMNDAKLKIIEALNRNTNTDDIDNLLRFSTNNNNKSAQVTNNQLMDTLTEDKTTETISKDVVLPKSIKITPLHKYTSDTGRFHCALVYGIQDSIFVQAEDYMYTYGLQRNEYRNLHCIVPSCKALAVQRSVAKNHYEDTIVVEYTHNHPPHGDCEQKKQMFYSVMRKRMQNDKSLNIRSLYEEFCQMEPELRELVPLRNVISEVCKHQLYARKPDVTSFEVFYDEIETCFTKLHFTISGQQFFQEKFYTEDGGLAVVFCNVDVAEQLSGSKIMYVDSSFKIETSEDFKYQLVTVLVWIEESYYPILFALVNKRSRPIYKRVFQHLHNHLAPNLRPDEIITDFEANLYYALGETYLNSHIGGSVFYYTQNLYKKVCALNLSRDLETNSYFRGIYHMLLMLPLLPVNTILDGLNNIETQAKESGLTDLARPLFEHVRQQWIYNVTPDLFCVHRLENRINENVIAPFKKLRDLLLVSKGKLSKNSINIIQVVQKLIDLESFLSDTYSKEDKRSFGRDLSSSQKKNVLRAWLFIETHPKININNFFTKVLGYIKCMENQLWIWGFYRFIGNSDDLLINANNFSIINIIDNTSVQFNDVESEDGCTEVLADDFTSEDNENNQDLDYVDEIIEEYTIPESDDKDDTEKSELTESLGVNMFMSTEEEVLENNEIIDCDGEVIKHDVIVESAAHILTNHNLHQVFTQNVGDCNETISSEDDVSEDVIHETICEQHDILEEASKVISEPINMSESIDILDESCEVICGPDKILGEITPPKPDIIIMDEVMDPNKLAMYFC